MVCVFCFFFVANHTNIQAVRPKLKTHCLGPENFPNCNFYKNNLTSEIGVWFVFFVFWQIIIFRINRRKIYAIRPKIKNNAWAWKSFQIAISTHRGVFFSLFVKQITGQSGQTVKAWTHEKFQISISTIRV